MPLNERPSFGRSIKKVQRSAKRNVTKYFWYKTCPICRGEGRLFIVEDQSNKRLYLHCEECSSGFLEPTNLDGKHSFLTLDLNFKYSLAEHNVISKYGWESYALNPVNQEVAPKL